MSIYNVTYDHDLYPGDLVCLEFLDALLAQEGDITLGDTTAVGAFAQATDASISTMKAAALAFWSTGVADSGSTTAVSGLSASTPREYFDGYYNGPGGTGTWQFDSTDSGGKYVTGLNFAKALRGLYDSYGYSTLVASLWTWLAAFTSNSAHETTAGLGNQAAGLATTGDYDPANALATKLRVQTAAGTTASDNGSELYDWATVGLLGPLRAARDASNFTEAKRAMSRPRRRAYSGIAAQTMDLPTLRGRSGLSFQMAFSETILSASRKVYDVVSAAMSALSYREQPKIYGIQG